MGDFQDVYLILRCLCKTNRSEFCIGLANGTMPCRAASAGVRLSIVLSAAKFPCEETGSALPSETTGSGVTRSGAPIGAAFLTSDPLCPNLSRRHHGPAGLESFDGPHKKGSLERVWKN